MILKGFFKFELLVIVGLIILVAILGLSCTQSSNSEISESNVNPITFSENSANLTVTVIDYQVPNTIFPIKQTKNMDCWAACSAMLVSWKEKKLVNTPQLVGRLSSKFGILYDTDTGLFPVDQADLLKELKLKQENPQNYTVQGWLTLLKNNGVLWVTTAIWTGKRWGAHARMVVGIKGNGDPNQTSLAIIDPASGKEISMTVTDFGKLMETLAIEDRGGPNGTGDIRPMVLHF